LDSQTTNTHPSPHHTKTQHVHWGYQFHFSVTHPIA
jgi:hypothetical protein